MIFLYSFSTIQSDSEEHQAACRLWQVYLQTRAEFVQPGDGDEDDEDGDDMMENPGMSTEDEVSYIARLYGCHLCATCMTFLQIVFLLNKWIFNVFKWLRCSVS